MTLKTFGNILFLIGQPIRQIIISTLILDEIEYLSKHPLSGQEFGFVKEGYFRSKVKSHFIFYRINDLKKEIEIIRILHQKMDILGRLED